MPVHSSFQVANWTTVQARVATRATHTGRVVPQDQSRTDRNSMQLLYDLPTVQGCEALSSTLYTFADVVGLVSCG